MPELPEVETVRRGLVAAMEGARFTHVEARRAALRIPLPKNFAARLTGARLEALGRRGKYLLGALSTGDTLIMHLGMTGRFTVEGPGAARPGAFYDASPANPRHDHIVFDMQGPGGRAQVVFNDPRRFGFMDLVASADLARCAHLAAMGPEPLDPAFSAAVFNRRLAGRSAPIKAALLDQRLIAGIGNIYACEALFRARISPRRKAAGVAGARGARLHAAIGAVLREAIEAGGSTLRDFAGASGAAGAFQHRFEVYDREGEPCRRCAEPVRRIVQAGRSTFYCGRCQS
jgi:formamidopyrimidine-DNA glycosylase